MEKKASNILNQMISELKRLKKGKDYSFIVSTDIFNDLNVEMKKRVVAYKGYRIHHHKMLKSDVAYMVSNNDVTKAMDHLRMLNQEL
ncbi:hypothetical protein UFOVP633_45 [uncultured Caudovirales phage]|uniref:Uncharacterized protein n=1 Tax=uncultured Caudovirales phage TaxID=2100421 RepID=A0A6J5N9Z6_9CAUD|nr:hypothetical protein UFOVP633_45 [uncultured Caudovirales phage]